MWKEHVMSEKIYLIKKKILISTEKIYSGSEFSQMRETFISIKKLTHNIR